jgi:glycosyltransferase involved in cell wall biosynthesis
MRVAYLVNQYPKISHTFIRREIAALEQQAIEVLRFSLRRAPADQLVDPADEREARRTTAILELGSARLLLAMLSQLALAPARFLSALRLAIRLGRRSERGLLINLIYFAEACALAAQLRKNSVERLHAHFGTNAAAVAMLCRALGGPSYSFTVHGPEEFDKPDLLHLRDKIQHCDGVFAVSHFGRSQLYRHCTHDQWSKVHVVPCGLDSAFLDSPPAAPVPAAPRLVSVGRLSEQKGQLLLIEALAELHRRGHAFHLTLVGDGEMRGEVEAAIERYHLGDKVELAGWADEAGIKRHVLAARALILPSFAEGLPVVIMEALALGRPVVSTYIAGIPELVEPGRSGWLVPAGSVGDLVSALEAVIAATPEQLAAMGAHGRTRVLERHDARKIGATIATLLRGLPSATPAATAAATATKRSA